MEVSRRLWHGHRTHPGGLRDAFLLRFRIFSQLQLPYYFARMAGWLARMTQWGKGGANTLFFVDCRVCFNFAFLFSHVFTFSRFALSLSLETGVELFLYCTGKSLTKIRTYALSFSLSLYFAHTVCRRKIYTHTRTTAHTHARAHTPGGKMGKIFHWFSVCPPKDMRFSSRLADKNISFPKRVLERYSPLVLAAGSFSVPSFFFFQIDFRTNRLKVTVALYVLSMNGRRTVEARTPASWNG